MANDVPSKSEIVRYWKTDFRFVHDIGEPDCWACHRSDKWLDIWEYLRKNGFALNRDDPYDMIKYTNQMWNNTNLERHHIVPASRQGSNDPSNLFLLCPNCHAQAPHTDDRDYFLQWALNREKEIAQELDLKLKQLAEMLGVRRQQLAILGNFVSSNYLFSPRPPDEIYLAATGGVSFHPFSDGFAYLRDHVVAVHTYIQANNISYETLAERDEAIRNKAAKKLFPVIKSKD